MEMEMELDSIGRMDERKLAKTLATLEIALNRVFAKAARLGLKVEWSCTEGVYNNFWEYPELDFRLLREVQP